MYRTIQDGVAWYRPYLYDGISLITVNSRVQLSEIPARLTLEQWVELDNLCEVEFKARTPVLQALLKCEGMNYRLPESQGLAKIVYEEKVEEPAKSKEDRPIYKLVSLPLPITHEPFTYPDGPKDPYIMARAAARRVGDEVEKTLLLGWETSPPYALQGFCNHAARFTISDVEVDPPIATALDLLQKNNYHGPYGYITGDGQDDADAAMSLVKGVAFALPSPHLPKRRKVLVQLTPDVCRIVVGQAPVAIQWESQYKFLAIVVPQLRTDFNGCLGVADIKQR